MYAIIILRLAFNLYFHFNSKGGLKILYENWRKQLIENMAFLEAIIDFGEDENIEDGVLERGKIVKLKI
jgi:tRNA U34 5-carboxymethylaminomethyl modifying GTPase MnmE/TrmE